MFNKNKALPQDPNLDKVKYIRVTGRSVRRNGESYTLDYDDINVGYIGTRDDLICIISVDSYLFCNKEFTKDTIEFLDQQKNIIDIRRYYYAITIDPDIGLGSFLIPLTPSAFKYVYEKYGGPSQSNL